MDCLEEMSTTWSIDVKSVKSSIVYYLFKLTHQKVCIRECIIFFQPIYFNVPLFFLINITWEKYIPFVNSKSRFLVNDESSYRNSIVIPFYQFQWWPEY